jgi:hypothetical protein
MSGRETRERAQFASVDGDVSAGELERPARVDALLCEVAARERSDAVDARGDGGGTTSEPRRSSPTPSDDRVAR